MSEEFAEHVAGTDFSREVPASGTDANQQHRLDLIERINRGELAAGACYLDSPIGPEITLLKLSSIQCWATSREQINERYAPQILAVLLVEWVQRATTLAGDAAREHLENALELISSASMCDAVVIETAIWLIALVCPEDVEVLAALREALANNIRASWVFNTASDDETGRNDDQRGGAVHDKCLPQIANELLISVRSCRGPHKARWFSPYDPDSTAEERPLHPAEVERLLKQLTSAEKYFRSVHDRVGLAMAIDQRALLAAAGAAEGVSRSDFVPWSCEAADLYADAKDYLREMLCWQRAAGSSLPEHPTHLLSEPVKYIVTRYAEAAHSSGFEALSNNIRKPWLQKPANSRVSISIALVVLLLLVAAFLKGDDTLVVLLLIGSVLVVHEAGHWIAACLAGIRIDTFRIGVGPRLFAWQAWGTDIEVHAFPALGYVSPVTTTAAWEEHRSSAFRGSATKVWQGLVPSDAFRETPVPHTELVSRLRQSLFVLGGVAVNLLAAILSFWLVSILDVQSRTHRAQIIGHVWAGGRGSAAGAQVGDKIISVQGKPCRYFGDDASGQLLRFRKEGDPASLPVVLSRGGENVAIEWPLATKDEWGLLGNGVDCPDSWAIDEVHASCAAVLSPGDVVEEASWRGHVVTQDNVASPHILQWLFEQAREEPVSLRVRRKQAKYDVQVHGVGRGIFDPEQVVDVEPRLVDVVAGSVAWQAGLRRGDLVREIDAKAVNTHRDLIAGLRASINRSVRCVIERGGKTLEIDFPGVEAFRDYANLGLTSGDWVPFMQGLKVMAIRPDWADDVSKMDVGVQLEEMSTGKPYVLRWRDGEGNQCSQDLTGFREDLALLRPIWLSPFKLKKASVTLPPDGPLTTAAKVAGQATQFFRSIPRNMVAAVTEVPSSSERQWVREAAARGFPDLLRGWATLNMVIGFANLLPVPPLDGFRLIQLMAGGVFRRTLPQRVRIALNITGFVIMLALCGLFLYQVIRDAVTALFMSVLV